MCENETRSAASPGADLQVYPLAAIAHTLARVVAAMCMIVDSSNDPMAARPMHLSVATPYVDSSNDPMAARPVATPYYQA